MQSRKSRALPSPIRYGRRTQKSLPFCRPLSAFFLKPACCLKNCDRGKKSSFSTASAGSGRSRSTSAESPPAMACDDEGAPSPPRHGRRAGSGRGGGGRRVAPGGQAGNAGEPITNVRIGRERQLGFLGIEQRRRNRKNGEPHGRH